jgi:hypothetical protein
VALPIAHGWIVLHPSGAYTLQRWRAYTSIRTFNQLVK